MSRTAPLPLATIRSDDIVVLSDGTVRFQFSPELHCQYDRATSALWSYWDLRGIPCFSPRLLADLERGSQVVEGYFTDQPDGQRLSFAVLRSLTKGVFSLGGDLGHFLRLIETRDRARLTEYARSAVNVAYRNYIAHNLRNVTMIALLEGDALGGGFESALSCDVIVAERHVRCGFPEVLFSMFPGMGGMSFITRRAGRRVANEMVRSGRQYCAEELLAMGVIDMVVETGQGVAAVNKLIQQWTPAADAHGAMNAVERLLRPVTLDELTEVGRLWVDVALNLNARGRSWMQRLHQQQLANFGRTLGLAPSAD